MSETTKILFNSPALHSLKREQLMKLCKIHSIKANGKNVELIERLKQHAQTLPKDDPLSIAARSDTGAIVARPLCNSSDTSQDESDFVSQQTTRPSEQWEVMESIQEVDETSSQGTLSSLRTIGTPQMSGEFGTASSKTSTVGSSLRALATSLGLKRTNKPTSTTSSKASSVTQEQPDDELMQHSIPYSAVRPATPPLSDNFTFDPTIALHTRMSFASNGEPLPGCSLRPGVPAPDNARLSLGTTQQQQTTTIRLVSNNATNGNESRMNEIFQTPKLKPFTPAFELVMSPGAQAKESADNAFWAPDTHLGQFQSLYPTLTVDDFPSPIKFPADKGSASDNGNAPAVPTTSAPTSITTPTTPTPDPFVFGSPLPQHSVSNTQFRSAASSVLEEMNKRLLSSGVEGLNVDLINKLQSGAHTQEQLEAERRNREVRPLPGGRSSNGGRGEITNKFDHAHEAEFAKMEGIDRMVRRREAGKKRSSGKSLPEVQPLVVGKKRKSSALGDGDGAPRRPTAGPGAAVGGRTSGTTRVISSGRRAKALPGAFGDDEDEDGAAPVGEDGREERGGKRVKIDSDAGANGDAATIDRSKEEGDDMDVDKEDQEEEKNQREREREAIKRKLEMSRAKRRSSAGGAIAAASARRSSARGPITPKTKSGRFGFLTSAKNLVASVWGRGKTAPPASTKGVPKSSGGAAKEEPTNKSSLFKKNGPTSAFAPTKSSATSSAGGTSSSRLSVTQGQKSVMARSRSPIPPMFSSNSGTATTTSRMSSVQTDSAAGSKTSRVGTVTSGSGSVSSIGMKPSAASNAGVGSMGTKPSRLRTSSTTSRLLAPTASSLAKARKLDAIASPPPSAAASVPGAQIGLKKKSSLLSPITNRSPRTKRIPLRGATISPLSSVRPKASSLPMWSPQQDQNAAPGRIFSKPIAVDGGSKIPTLSLKPSEDQDVVMAEAETGKDPGTAQKNTGSVTRQRTITRKPRISRSKVIARLASQRAAASSSASRTQVRSGTSLAHGSKATNGLKPRTPSGAHKRTRSSIGARPSRASFTGPVRGANLGGGRGDKEMSILASARKRVRQSEYARRRSRVSGIAVQTDAED